MVQQISPTIHSYQISWSWWRRSNECSWINNLFKSTNQTRF